MGLCGHMMNFMFCETGSFIFNIDCLGKTLYHGQLSYIVVSELMTFSSLGFFFIAAYIVW